MRVLDAYLQGADPFEKSIMNRHEPPWQLLRRAETMPTGSIPSGRSDDELQRVRRALNTLRATNRALLRAADEASLLSGICRGGGEASQMIRMTSKREQAERMLKRMAFYDALTELPNRVRLRELLEQAIAAAKQQRRPLSLLLVGTGRFSEINETLGYREGDKLLQEIALRLQKAVGVAESVARMGENEFAVLVPNSDAEQATRFAAKILLALYEPIELSGLMLDPRASIGITLFPGHGTDPDVLIRRAYLALHQAKRTGSGYAVYAGGLDKNGTHRLALMGDLRSAIDNNELLLYCQPKVDIRAARVCGAEALVRGRHPEKG